MNLNLNQVVLGLRSDAPAKKPVTAEALRDVRHVQLVQVRGKNRTLRNVFVSAEARGTLVDYLEMERQSDAAEFPGATVLFLRAASVRLSKTVSQEERRGTWLCARSTTYFLRSGSGTTPNLRMTTRVVSSRSTRTC